MRGATPDLSKTKKISGVSKLTKIKEVDRKSLPKAIQEQTDNLLIVRRDTLEQLGIDRATIDKLLDAKVAAHHRFLTCGDYNL